MKSIQILFILYLVQDLDSMPTLFMGTVNSYLALVQSYVNSVAPGMTVPFPPKGSGDIAIIAPPIPVVTTTAPTTSATTTTTTTTLAPSCSTEAGLYWYCEEGTSRWAYDCDFPGFDVLFAVTSTRQQCASTCRYNEEGCTKYTWTASNKACYMKNSPKSAVNVSGNICGYI